MAGPRIELFSGIRPRASKLRLPPGEASAALDVDLRKGLLRPRPKQLAWDHTADQRINLGALVEPLTLFLFRDKDTGVRTWMYWTTDVDVVSSPAENAEQRHYYTGDGIPKMFTAESLFDTTPPYPQAADSKYPFTWYALGVPAPTTAPNVDAGSYIPPSEGSTGLITSVACDALSFKINNNKRTTSAFQNDTAGEDGRTAGAANSMTPVYARAPNPQPIVCLNAGSRFRVTEIVDGDTVKVVRSGASGPAEDLGVVPEEDWRWSLSSSSQSGFASKHQTLTRTSREEANRKSYFLLPEEVTLGVENHMLAVDDVIRITGSSTAMTWSSTTVLVLSPVQPKETNVGFRTLTPDAGTVLFSGETSYAIERNGSLIDPVVPAEADVEIVTRAYVYTYVSFLGEESAPSPPSEIITMRDGDTVTINGLELPPTERRSIDRIWIYRSNTGSTDTAFQFVGEIAVDADSLDLAFTDDVLDEDLGEELQTEGWDTPPTDLAGIVATPNGYMVGFSGNTLCFSEPGFPHAWPSDYRQSVDFQIVGLAVYGNSVYVTTKGTPFIAVGVHPLQTSLRRVDIRHQCVDKKSIVNTGQRILYVGREGLIAAGDRGFANETAQHYTREQWQALIDDATAIRGWYYDNQYIFQVEYASGDPTRLVFDYRDGELRITTFSEDIVAAHADPESAELYYVVPANDEDSLDSIDSLDAAARPLLRWDYAHPNGGTNYAGRWVSGLIRFPEPMSISCARVVCRRVAAASGDEADCYAAVSIEGFRFADWTSGSGLGDDELELISSIRQVLIEGRPGVGGWAGEQRGRPFRTGTNTLVDAVQITLDIEGPVEIESVALGRNIQDLSST